MRTTDATRKPGPEKPGSSRSEAERGSQLLSVVENPSHGDLSPRKPLALCTEPQLVELARSGEKRAVEKILSDCRPIILYEVKRQNFRLNMFGLDCWWDLYQEGVLAVFDALERYRPERARGKIKYYAERRIKTYVRVAAGKLARPESITSTLVQEMSAAANAAEFTQPADEAEDECEGSARGSAMAQGGSGDSTAPDRVSLALNRPRPYSLEFDVTKRYIDGDAHSATLKDLIADTTEPGPGEEGSASEPSAVVEMIQADTLHQAVSDLEEDERIAVVGRYGLGTEPALCVEDLAQRLGMSHSSVKNVLARARASLSVKLAMLCFEGAHESAIDEADWRNQPALTA